MKTIPKPRNGNGTSSLMEKAQKLTSEPRQTSKKLVELPKLNIRIADLEIVGTSPLIVHAWSAKAIRMMLDKQMGIASAGREKKNPLEDFRGSLYPSQDGLGWGIPAPAFKACAVSAANDVGLKMTESKRAFHVQSYTVKIEAPPLSEEMYTEWDNEYREDLKREHASGLSMRMDLVRLESGVADIRFRGCWPIWGCKIQVEYNSNILSLDQIVNIFRTGGYSCGVGEWRPSSPVCRSGEFGRFEVK